jgi:hypothetical protein
VIRVNTNIFNTIYQAILQVDKKSYECLNKSGDLFVGYDSRCPVYMNALDKLRSDILGA